MIIVEESVKLEWYTHNPLKVIEKAARTCYKSEDRAGNGTAEVLVSKILNREIPHLSVLEHAVASFRIVCDRGVSHELVRHRIASYSQESTRYCNYNKGKFNGQIRVIVPVGIEPNSEGYTAWEDAVKFAEERYKKLIGLGYPPEISRSVLPTCLATEIVMTANFAEWLHIIKLRTHKDAHPQMRRIANMIRAYLFGVAPVIFGGGNDEEKA